MPCYESLNVYLLSWVKGVECGVVADCSRTAVACRHPVPIDLEPNADLRIRILESLAVASICGGVLEDSVGVAECLTARVWPSPVRGRVLCSTFSAHSPVIDS